MAATLTVMVMVTVMEERCRMRWRWLEMQHHDKEYPLALERFLMSFLIFHCSTALSASSVDAIGVPRKHEIIK